MIKVSISTAARLMNKGQQFVRVSLQRGLVPFGYAVKLQEKRTSRYDYYINPKQFCEYLGITEEDLKEGAEADVAARQAEEEKLYEPLFQ